MSYGRNGPLHSSYVSALQAFWPGLQVLAGHIKEAEVGFSGLLKIWSKYNNLPDMYDTSSESLLHHSQGYPLRPELVV